jgi:hypothetical protein
VADFISGSAAAITGFFDSPTPSGGGDVGSPDSQHYDPPSPGQG